MPYQLTLPNGKVVGDIPDNIPQDKALGIIRGKMPDAFSAREEARKGTYELTLPNGKVVGDVPEGMPREQALEMIRARMPDAFSSPKEGMGAAFMGGLESLGSRLRTGVEAIVSPEEAARRGLERGEAISREYAPGASLQRVKDVYAERGLLPAAGEAISQIPTALAEQAPNMAATIASAKLGAMGGTAIAPGLGTVIGGVGGALAPSLMQLFGSNIERQAEVQRERGEPIDISRGKALAAAVPGAALEAASTFVPLGRTVVGKLLGPQGAKMLERGSTEATEALAKESLLKVAGKGAAIGAGVEIPTEVTQQMLERLQAGLPVTSEDALTEYGEAMYGAGLVGGPFGAAGRVGQRSLARQTLNPETAPEAPPEAVPPQAAPIPPSAYFDEPSPLENPYGNITAEAMPDVADEINAIRSKNKQSPLDSFSIEDAVNAGLPQERVDSILSSSLERAGISPELQINPEDVYDAASVSGLDIEQPGFRDFLRRATGSESPEEMSPVQRVAALGAIQNIPEGVDSLPLGTNARSFTEAQYKAGLKAIKSAPAEGVTREEMVASIQQSGVKDMREAMSVLQTAIREGNVGGVSAPAYAVFDESGNAVGRYNDPQEASERAERLNGSVTEFAQTRYFPVEAGRAPAQQPAAAPRDVAPDVAALRQKLAPALKRFGLEGVGLRVVKSIEDGGAGADGAYANKLIQVALSAENPMGVMRHEVIHALKELGAFTAKEWRVLEGKAKSEWVNKFIREAGTYERYQQVYENATGSLEGFDEYINEEAIAEAFKYFDATKVPPGLVGNLFGRIRNLFASLRNALQGAGFQTAEEVLGRIEEGKVTPTQAEAPAAAPKFSVAPETDEQFFIRQQNKPDAKQVVFEIAPNPDDADLSGEWNSLSVDQRKDISGKIKNKLTKSVLDSIGARGRITEQVGSYLNDTNASFALYLEKGDAITVAKSLGFVFSQQSMMAVSPSKAKGMTEYGAVTIEIGDKNFDQIQDIYNTLRQMDINGQSPVGGQTTSNGMMTILNDPEESGVDNEELADYIDAALGYKYNVLTENVFASFPSAKDYDYASPQNDPAGKAGDIRKRLRSIRDEASETIRREIDAARGQPKAGAKAGEAKRVTTDTIVIDGVIRSTRNSNGKSIHPTEEGVRNFWKWFGDAVTVDRRGRPVVMYHGTSRDITEFRPRQANAIFITPNPSFADDFTSISEGEMRGEFFNSMTPEQRYEMIMGAAKKYLDRQYINRADYNKIKNDYKGLDFKYEKIPTELETEVDERISNALPSKANILPLYVAAKNPFDFENPKHVDKLINTIEGGGGYIDDIEVKDIKLGRWAAIEENHIQKALIDARFDGFFVNEGGEKNLAVYDRRQIKSAVGNAGTFDPANKDIRYSLQGGKAFELDPTTSKDNFVYLFADKNIDLKRVTEGVYKQGNKIADRWNAYEKEEAYYGRAAERIKQFATRDLHQLTKKMDGANISLQEMDDYLLARHAKEANAYLRTINPDPNQNAGMSDAEADAYMKAVPAAKKAILDRLAKDVDAITKGTRDLMVEYGLEDQKTVDQWAKTYKHYVPLFREETEESLPLSAGRGFSVRGSTSKRRTGSARKVVDVMANIALQREKVIARGEHNRVGNSLYGMVLLNPNPDFWSVIRPEKMTKDQLRTELFKLGIDPQSVDEMADRPVEKVIDKKTGMVTYNVPPFWKSNNNLLFTRINGKERIIAFNKNDERAMRLVTALKGMDAQKQAEVIKSMGTAGDYFNKAINFTGKTTRYFASINTQYNPAFGIYNLMRDVGGATINLQTTPLKGMERKVVSDAMVALKDIYKDLRRAREGLPPKSKWGQVFEDFGLQGGKSGFSELFKDSQDRSESLQNELKRFKEGKIKSKGRALMEWLSDFNEAIENAIRVSVYKNALDKGLSKQKAASLGKNITVNFNRTGAMSKHIQTLYAFFNAAIQGSARIAETLMTSDGKLSSFGKKFVAGGITLGMMQAVLLAMAGIDDDEIPEYIKDKSMVIPYGSGKYFSIPLPLGYHVIPAFGRRAMEFAMSDDKNVGKATISTAMMIADGFNPFGSATFLQTISPTALDPLVALAENKDFNSKPIAIEDVSSMSPTPGYERSSQNALAVTKAIAYGVNILSGGTEFKPGDVSPTADQIEYLVGQITGGVGREALKIGRGTESIVTGEELATYNIPIIGRLVGNTQQQAAQRARFYDNIKTMNEHQAEMEGRLNSDQDVTEYLKKYPEAALSQEADKIYRKISQLRSEKEELKTLGEGRESIKRIDDLILELMTGFNELKTNYSKEIKANQ